MEEELDRLKTLRILGQHIGMRIVKTQHDVVAAFIVGSVARGNIHSVSDIDLCILIEHGDRPKREIIEESGYEVDITYIPLHLWEENLYRGIGSEWEIEASNIIDSIIIYDPKKLIKKVKEYLKTYPEEKRRMNILFTYHRMGWFREAVKYHYIRRNYDFESIFSKIYAITALKILFSLNRVYLKGDKYIFDQVKELQKIPPSFLEKCLNLLYFKSKNVKYEEAKWIFRTVSDIQKTIENIVIKFI